MCEDQLWPKCGSIVQLATGVYALVRRWLLWMKMNVARHGSNGAYMYRHE
jgi:hypothetical protein